MEKCLPHSVRIVTNVLHLDTNTAHDRIYLPSNVSTRTMHAFLIHILNLCHFMLMVFLSNCWYDVYISLSHLFLSPNIVSFEFIYHRMKENGEQQGGKFVQHEDICRSDNIACNGIVIPKNSVYNISHLHRSILIEFFLRARNNALDSSVGVDFDYISNFHTPNETHSL